MPGHNYSNHYTIRNNIRLVNGGHEYFHLLGNLIDKATVSIHIQMYIFDDDNTGQWIAHRLMEASRRGVQVYLIVDGYASQGLSKKFIRGLKEAGIHFRFFQPLLKSSRFYLGRRMHHKIVVIDEKTAIIGGVNIADRYNDLAGNNPWLDMALYIEGEAIIDIIAVCKSFWEKETAQIGLVTSSNSISSMPHRDYFSVRIRQNDWVSGRHQIWRTYFDLFKNAQEKITIMCSYFLPGRQLKRQLSRAAKRGVKIKVILAGPSDVMVAKYAERYLYGWMLNNGIEIYEYQPSVLHAKLSVVDEHWVTIGSYNINNISAYASIELNADVRNKPFAKSVQEKLDTIIERDCLQVKPRQLKYSFFKKAIQKASYEFIRIALNLSTFYFKREE